jgi:pyruvate dehydrogenase E2 component (dihydrolipoamide acetyltransferase)
MYELASFTAVINTPESGILAVGGIADKPVAVDGELVIRPICSLSLTYDHRIIDGAPAAEFIRDIKRILENPYLLL